MLISLSISPGAHAIILVYGNGKPVSVSEIYTFAIRFGGGIIPYHGADDGIFAPNTSETREHLEILDEPIHRPSAQLRGEVVVMRTELLVSRASKFWGILKDITSYYTRLTGCPRTAVGSLFADLARLKINCGNPSKCKCLLLGWFSMHPSRYAGASIETCAGVSVTMYKCRRVHFQKK